MTKESQFGLADDTAMGRFVEFLFMWVVCLPLSFTEHRGRAARMAGLAVHVVWCIPAMLLTAPLLLVGICGDIVTHTWRGDW